MPRMSSSVTSSTRSVPTSRPFFITDDPVAEPHHVVDVVADQEDAEALRLQLLDEVGDHRVSCDAERGGGLVHDQDAGVEVDRAGDRHRLPLPARERAAPAR